MKQAGKSARLEDVFQILPARNLDPITVQKAVLGGVVRSGFSWNAFIQLYLATLATLSSSETGQQAWRSGTQV